MAADIPMTFDELINNYEYKIVKKMVMREYPWIKNMDIEEDDLNKYNLIFVNLYINPFELGKKYGWEVAWYIVRKIKNNETFYSPYLATFFSAADAVLKEDMAQDVRNLQYKIEKDMASVHSSPALPEDLRLPGNRKIQIDSFFIMPNLTIPEEGTEHPPFWSS